MANKKHGQFAPANELLQVSFFGFGGNLRGLLDGACNGQRTNVAEVEIRRQTAGAARLRVVAGLIVAGQVVADKLAQALERGVRASGKGVYGLDGAVKLCETGGDVVGEGKRLQLFFESVLGLGRWSCGLLQIFRQFALQMGAKMVQQHEAAIEDAGWHNHVGIDGPEGNLESLGQHAPPALRLATGVFVADQQRGLHFFKERFEGIRWRPPDYEDESTLGGVFSNIAQPLG